MEQADMAVKEGDVVFDPRTRLFLQVRKIREDVIECGGFCTYYGDAKTDTTQQPLSKAYVLQGCRAVKALDKYPTLLFDSIGWRAKTKVEEET